MKATALAVLVTATFAAGSAFAQSGRGGAPPPAPMRKASDLIKKQKPAVIEKSLADVINPDNSSVIVSLGKQRVYLMVGEQVYIDSPISSGKRAGMTPTGRFKITE
jgi:hypothetical protein